MRRIVVGLVGVLIAFGSTSAVAASAGSPTVHVTPRTGLVAGQIVLVSGGGWNFDQHIELFQCSGGVWTGDQSACAFAEFTGMNQGHRGFFASRYAVAGAVGDGYCGTRGTLRSCAFEVVQLDANNEPTSITALRRVVFAP